MNYDVRSTRKLLVKCRAKIRATRIAYCSMMRKRFDALPKSKRMRFLVEMPERMRELGMYAPSTLNGDICSVIVRQWFREDRIVNDWRKTYDMWQNWQIENGINWAEARREYGKLRLEMAAKGVE